MKPRRDHALSAAVSSHLAFAAPHDCVCAALQEAGYFNIDPTTDKNYFYWFFESRGSPSTDPLVLWLTGGVSSSRARMRGALGNWRPARASTLTQPCSTCPCRPLVLQPGCSSMLALLMENGPCSVKADGSGTTLNPWSWNTGANSACLPPRDVTAPAGTWASTQLAHTDVAGAPRRLPALHLFWRLRPPPTCLRASLAPLPQSSTWTSPRAPASPTPRRRATTTTRRRCPRTCTASCRCAGWGREGVRVLSRDETPWWLAVTRTQAQHPRYTSLATSAARPASSSSSSPPLGQAFLAAHPELQGRPFFVTGESYGACAPLR